MELLRDFELERDTYFKDRATNDPINSLAIASYSQQVQSLVDEVAARIEGLKAAREDLENVLSCPCLESEERIEFVFTHPPGKNSLVNVKNCLEFTRAAERHGTSPIVLDPPPISLFTCGSDTGSAAVQRARNRAAGSLPFIVRIIGTRLSVGHLVELLFYSHEKEFASHVRISHHDDRGPTGE